MRSKTRKRTRFSRGGKIVPYRRRKRQRHGGSTSRRRR